tara:strand:- start:244 stop:642 length:399 start_codon:yes stop_codon:yes gene_type:complete
MKDKIKSEDAYKTIGEVAKELNLIDKKSGIIKTHIIRYWETQFKQIKPKIKAGKRRYYSKENLNKIKLIQFLLKEKGFTINGVKKLLDKRNIESIDHYNDLGINTMNLKTENIIKEKVKKISKIVKEIKEME